MISAEEISEFKRAYHNLEKRMKKIEKDPSTVVKLSKSLKGLMENIESTHEKEKNTWNPAVSTRMKIAKKGFKLSKKLNYLEREVAKEFEGGNISEEEGKKFISIIKSIKTNQVHIAKKEFEYFEEILELTKEYERAEEEMKEKDQLLRREQLKIKNILAEMSELEKETIDLEKVRKYKELFKNLEKLEKTRETYLHSLLSEPVAKLLEDIEKQSLRDYYQEFPKKGEITKLKEFFFEYPVFGKCNVGQLCEFFGYSEKKLSHVCPETSKFRRIVLGNRKFFETIHTLKQTSFLAVDDENEKVMDFYAKRTEGAQKTVEQIRQLGKEKLSYRQEYEKSKRIEKRKKELSKYSKKELETELENTEKLLESLHSPPKDKPVAREPPKKPSIFSKILSILE
jgi:hypothetical protein